MKKTLSTQDLPSSNILKQQLDAMVAPRVSESMSLAPVISPEAVGQFYDQTGIFWEMLWGESIHVGYWPTGTDVGSIADAQDQYTMLMLSKVGVTHGQRFLDVGCGTGRPGLLLAQTTGASVTGVTISPSQIEKALHRVTRAGMAGGVSFQLADAMSLPFDRESFDGSWALECLFHMPDRSRVLREIARVLRPGGRLVIADVIERIPMNSDEKQFLQSGFMVNSVIGRSDYLRTLQDAGFEVVETLDITPNIRRTFPLSEEALERRDADLLKALGKETAAVMKATFYRSLDIYQRCLDYIVFTARKIAGPSA